jgi:sulfate permease, SulP family
VSLRGASPSGVPRDVLAGVTVAAIAIPEGLGYAQIAGLPVQTGLYCALLPPLLFALLGSSRQLVVGADSATAALVAAGAGAVAAAGTQDYVNAVAVLGLFTAMFLVLVAVAGLGFLADLMSQPVIAGFLSGVGVSLMIGKAPGMLGLEAHGTTWDKLTYTLTHLGDAVPAAAVLSIGAVAIMLTIERRFSKLPAALVALVAASLAGIALDAQARGVAMVGALPAGLPQLGWPGLQEAGQYYRMAGTAASIAVVILAQSAAVSRSFALQNKYPVNVRTDMLGLAAANLGSAVTQGFAINGSPPRTAAGDGAGGRSQVINLAQAVTVALVLLFLTGMFDVIPSCVLDGVVFAIGVTLIKSATLRGVGRARRSELLVALVTLGVVAFVGVEQGVLLAIVLSLIDRLRRQYHPHVAVLIEDGNVAERLRLRVPVERSKLEGVLVMRFGAALFFENATFFDERARELLASARSPVRVLVLDCAAMEDLDYTGAQTVAALGRDLRAQGAELVVTESSDDVNRMLRVTGADVDVVLVPRLEQAVLVAPAAPGGG